MPGFSDSLFVRQPVEVVFAALCCLEDIPCFVPQVRSVRVLTLGAPGPGTQFEQTARFWGVTTRVLTEVTHLQQDRLLAYRSLTGVLRYRAHYLLSAADGGAYLAYTVVVAIPWPLRWAGPVLMGVVKRVYKQNMALLGWLLEEHGALCP